MRLNRFVFAAAVFGALALSADPALAQRHGHAGARVGVAVPRPGVGHGYRPILVPRHVMSPVYYGYPRSFYYGPHFTFGFGIGFGYPYGYYPYGYYPYGYYRYGYYPYGYYPYGYYPYAYPYYPYWSGYGAGGVYGGVRIDLPQKGAEVFADGNYVGTVDDFDGTFQRLELPGGPHRIEVRAVGFAPLAFQVNVDPWRTIHYRATLTPRP